MTLEPCGARRAAVLETGGVPDLDVPSCGPPNWAQAFAIGMFERARDQGQAVPGDLAVISYDDVVAAASDPPLTAVRPEKHRLGALAAELALARVADGIERPVHRVRLWPTLVARGPCGAAAVAGAP